jgi:phage terminase large subunit GpA-like protein
MAKGDEEGWWEAPPAKYWKCPACDLSSTPQAWIALEAPCEDCGETHDARQCPHCGEVIEEEFSEYILPGIPPQ